MQSRICLLISVFLLSACAPGPLVTDCVSTPATNNFSCYNEAQKKSLMQAPSQVDNWIFLSPADEASALVACSNKTSAKVAPCVFSAASMSFACFSEVTGQSFGMTFAQSSNWIGVSPVDEQILLTYCASLKPS